MKLEDKDQVKWPEICQILKMQMRVINKFKKWADNMLKRKKLCKMHLLILFCGNACGKCTKYETST